MMPNLRTVGIVICTRDRPALLAKALQAVACQSYPHRKLVVIDDGQCEVRTQQVLSTSNESILYIKNSRTLGAAATRNLGLQHVLELEPDLVCMLDDDDNWIERRLELGIAAMKPNVGMSYGIQWMTDELLRPLFKYPSRTSWRYCRFHAVIFGEFTFPAKTYMFNPRFLEEIKLSDGRWYADVGSREDVDLGIRALRYANKHQKWEVAFIDSVLAFWVQAKAEKFFEAEHVRKQQTSHELLVRDYLPPWIQRFALTTAPYLIRLPHVLRFLIQRVGANTGTIGRSQSNAIH